MNNGADLRIREAEGTARPRRVLFDAGEAEAVESVPPQSAGVGLGAEFPGDLLVLDAVGGPQEDPGPEDEPMRRGPTPCPRSELVSLLGRQDNRRSDTHEEEKVFRDINVVRQRTLH